MQNQLFQIKLFALSYGGISPSDIALTTVLGVVVACLLTGVAICLFFVMKRIKIRSKLTATKTK